jgi:hypothetical protein
MLYAKLLAGEYFHFSRLNVGSAQEFRLSTYALKVNGLR